MTYLAIKTTSAVIPNPYYTDMLGSIEPMTITETVSRNEFIFSDVALTKYLEENASLIEQKVVRIYKVEEVFPRIETITRISFGPDMERKVSRKYLPARN